MRGVDLKVFDFDFDLTWAALFMNADDHVYGRYGSRDDGNAESGLSLKGLKYAMQQALVAYGESPKAKPQTTVNAMRKFPEVPEKYAAAKRLKADACIHCHQLYNFRHDHLLSAKSWTKSEMWQYPPAGSIGLDLDIAQSDKIANVIAKSAASAVGLQKGDVLSRIGEFRISSEADLQYALNQAPETGTLKIAWSRSGRTMTGTIALAKDWRRSDISWRTSMWTMPPAMGTYGKNLTIEEKKALGLGPKRLAFRQGNYVPNKTRRAGIRGKDIIIGIDGKPLEMTMLEFNVYVRENFDVGDRVVFDVIRGKQRLKIPMTLPVNPR